MGKNNSMFLEQEALSTTPEVIFGDDPSRNFCEVANIDAAIIVYIGKDSTVSSSTGYPVRPGTAFGFENYTGPVWAVAASGTPTVSLITW
jgi:hypothetical protein